MNSDEKNMIKGPINRILKNNICHSQNICLFSYRSFVIMINEYIKSDIYRYYGCFNLKTMMRAILSSTLRFQIVFRMCQMNGFWQKYNGLIN